MRITRARARAFLLYRHGLLGARRFHGRQGVRSLVQQWGCLQFDPVNVCGRAPEISLLARVEDYRPEFLHDLLYRDRMLFDYLDKEQSILPIEAWPGLSRRRSTSAGHWRSRGAVEEAADAVLAEVADRGPLCSSDLDLPGKVSWYWSDSTLSRVVLEALYLRGDLVIHHKQGVRKYYDLASRLLPEALLSAPDPYPSDEDFVDAKVYQRIRGVGMLWTRAGAAWLGAGPQPNRPLRAADRLAAFGRLLASGRIVPLEVEGVAQTLYCASVDLPLVLSVEPPTGPAGDVRLIGPLDTMLWDRALVKALFDFDYTWEIYTPAAKRRYAAYVLPMIEGADLVGRVACRRRAGGRDVVLDDVWYEPSWRRTKGHAARLREAVHRLVRVNG